MGASEAGSQKVRVRRWLGCADSPPRPPLCSPAPVHISPPQGTQAGLAEAGEGPTCVHAWGTARAHTHQPALSPRLPPSSSSAATTSGKPALTAGARAPPARRARAHACSGTPCLALGASARPAGYLDPRPQSRLHGERGSGRAQSGCRQGTLGVNGKLASRPSPGQEAQSHGGGEGRFLPADRRDVGRGRGGGRAPRAQPGSGEERPSTSRWGLAHQEAVRTLGQSPRSWAWAWACGGGWPIGPVLTLLLQCPSSGPRAP